MKKRIVFVCVENARSQMAEAFFKKHASDNFEAVSASIVPSKEVNPYAISVMKLEYTSQTKNQSKSTTK